jgi:hypothetical protein
MPTSQPNAVTSGSRMPSSHVSSPQYRQTQTDSANPPGVVPVLIERKSSRNTSAKSGQPALQPMNGFIVIPLASSSNCGGLVPGSQQVRQQQQSSPSVIVPSTTTGTPPRIVHDPRRKRGGSHSPLRRFFPHLSQRISVIMALGSSSCPPGYLWCLDSRRSESRCLACPA